MQALISHPHYAEPYDTGFIFMIFEASAMSPTPSDVSVPQSKFILLQCFLQDEY